MKRLATTLLIASTLACSPVLAESNEEAQVIKVLESASLPVEKEAACRQLKRIGTAKAVPALAALLTDEPLAQWAIDALETMPCPEAAEALRGGLESMVALTRARIAHAVGERRDRQALPGLARLLSDPDATVAIAAAEAMGKIGGSEAIDALKKAKATVSAPVRCGIVDAELACAERLLADGDAKGASAIYKEMHESKEPDHVRVAGYRGLVLASDDGAVAMVVAGLKGTDGSAQLASVQLVPEIKGENATQAFTAALAAAAPRTQVALLDALSMRGDPAAAAAVAAMARSADASVRVAAFKALAELGDTSCLPLLAEAAVSGGEEERGAARQSLVLLRRGDVRQAMLELIEKSRPEVQGKLIAVLGSRGERPAVPALLKLAQTQREPVNIAAIAALKRLADASQAEALLGLILRASSDAAREVAQSTFVAVGADSKERERFARLALDSMQGAEVPARCCLLRAAGQLGGAGVAEALRAGAKDEDPRIREAAIGTMADHAGPEAVGDLARIAHEATDASQAGLALRGYWRLARLMKDRPADERFKLCQEGLAAARDAEGKRIGLSELAKLADPKALALAEEYRHDEAVKAEAEAACYQIAACLIYAQRAASEATLRALAKDAASEGVRKNASAFLASLEKHADFVVPWMVSGPYRVQGKEAQGLFDVAMAPEQADGAKATWRLEPAPSEPANFWQADLGGVVGGDHCVVYLKTRVFSPKAQPVSLEIGSDDGIKLWINGAVVHANNAVRGMAPAQDRAKAELKEGWNDLMAKVTQHTLGCGLCLRITAADGSPIQGLRTEPSGK
ncbi:MAG: HEAT repeat domain-containing protein [Phycisphaerae bacterium]|nr:HEAT repeat domain-containing protein [Phycisphaerae bacterium]